MIKAFAFLAQAAALLFALAGAILIFKYGVPALQQMFMGLQAESPEFIVLGGRGYSPGVVIVISFVAALVLYFAARGLHKAADEGGR